jgi:DNA-binding response OmpR family regulator
MPRVARPVLVVEDDRDTREMVELILKIDGYLVATACDGAEALDAVVREPPCLILLDLAMPVMDGKTFARRLRELPDQRLATTPILLLTAIGDVDDVVRETGAVGLLRKPVEYDEIRQRVRIHCPV